MKTDNELIAEFMGMRIEKSKTPSGNDWYRGICFYPVYKTVKEWTCGASTEKQVKESLKAFEHNYDTSWDWLMPVVEKIENLGVSTQIKCDGISTTVTIGSNPSVWQNPSTKIEKVYFAVVEFIKWYNSQQK